MTDAAAEQIWSEDAVRDRVPGEVPLGRMADVEEIVEPARCLLSAGSGYLTGAMLKADGVWTFKKWLYRGPEES